MILGSHPLNRTRNAVDRFTGGAGDKKLFTGRPEYGGKGTLEIKLSKNICNFPLAEKLIDICIEDMNDGFLMVGGETSTGGGLIHTGNKEANE
ncbi:hypothetical protein FACS1894105_00520 [Clostridia bacterium]|nr:hypothetical protein FACS1894105_00520 [Clostridia bacterium]